MFTLLYESEQSHEITCLKLQSENLHCALLVRLYRLFSNSIKILLHLFVLKLRLIFASVYFPNFISDVHYVDMGFLTLPNYSVY